MDLLLIFGKHKQNGLITKTLKSLVINEDLVKSMFVSCLLTSRLQQSPILSGNSIKEFESRFNSFMQYKLAMFSDTL